MAQRKGQAKVSYCIGQSITRYVRCRCRTICPITYTVKATDSQGNPIISEDHSIFDRHPCSMRTEIIAVP